MPSMYDITKDTTVPIVGQGVVVLGYTIVPMVKCDCGSLSPLQPVLQASEAGTVATIALCAQCQTTYRITGLTLDRQGQILFTLDQQKPVAV